MKFSPVRWKWVYRREIAAYRAKRNAQNNLRGHDEALKSYLRG